MDDIELGSYDATLDELPINYAVAADTQIDDPPHLRLRVDLRDFAYMQDFDGVIASLASLAEPEDREYHNTMAERVKPGEGPCGKFSRRHQLHPSPRSGGG